ncbi:glycosyltransferase [Candidatus Pelagibacter bacterium]|nr:glycosyltransferase family 2 protein [Candidatus Pelagibacter bacterium]MDA8805038.1 glycosyltransferase [Candidatus Pelagibacter bacterium]
MKVSIITVTLNSITTINDCINSVKEQKYNNIEHIIIDGGSTDGTLSLLESKKDQFAILVSELDKGIYDAMNKGINIATGDIIGFLNSDDFYVNENVISKIITLFKKNDSLEGCYSDLIYIDKFDITKTIRYWKSSEFRSGLFSKGWSPPHTTFFVRNSIYKKFGCFNLNYQISSDIDLMMRFLEIHRINVQYVPEIWIKMRMGGASNKSVRSIINQNLEVLNALAKNNLPSNFLIFSIFKIISRVKQFFQKPKN